MNKTRFYEILQAHKKGEDLKQFVPTNPAEAALIADLTGNTGSNNSENKALSLISLNNKDLPNLYYGQAINNETVLVIDFDKLIEAYDSMGVIDNPAYGAYAEFPLFEIACFSIRDDGQLLRSIYDVILNNNNYYCSIYSGVSDYYKGDHINVKEFEDGKTHTYRELFQDVGIMKIRLYDIISHNGNSSSDLGMGGIINKIYAADKSNLENSNTKCANLKEKPINYMWFE